MNARLAVITEEPSASAVIHRPWGSYQDLDMGPGFRVKRITVKPGGKLSLQYHHYRSEHWVVVRGLARATRGNDVRMLRPDESIHIGVGQVHRLENAGTELLELIEVQCGEYTGEDDIVRVEDIYNRVPLASVPQPTPQAGA